MRNLIEKISWIPFKFLMKIKNNNKKNPICFDFNKIDLNKRFIFYFPDEDCGLSQQLRVFGFREPLNYLQYSRFIDSSDNVLDVGANIGMFTLLSDKAKKIVCVEPLKQAIPVLEKNIEKNNLSKKCEIINAAVGRKGKLFLEVDSQLNLSRIVDKKNENTTAVESIPIYDLIKKYKLNFIRMDVEGYEYEILMNNIPSEIKKIGIEFHAKKLGKKKTLELLDYFQQQGFKAKYLIEDLPLRLYPFQYILRKTKLINLFTYVKRDLSPKKCFKYLFEGRDLKYFMLER